MPRPSPRTGTTGVGITKFGTQQLKYLDPEKPASGVIEIDTGAITRLGFSGETSGTATTPFSQRYQEQRPATIRTFAELETSPHAPTKGFGSFELPDLGLGDLFGNGNGKENGEDCGWFGEKCWDEEKENGEDCGWFGEKCWGKENGEDCGWFGEKCWFKNLNLGWVKWVLLAVGIGVLLWLLRPLFGLAKNITEK
jgi:hypothetical protein